MSAVIRQPVRGSRFPTLEKYDVLEELGHGGMATVYRAKDLRLGRDVAVKVIHPHLRDSAEAVRRFSIEARAVAKLRHGNIVEVYDVSAEADAEQYLVVELLRGVTLRKLLEQHGALPAEVAASIGVELLAALAHAHDAGVVHRDVKPENVILEHRASPAKTGGTADATDAEALETAAPRASETPGDRITIKLTDFGIAKLLDAQGVTSTGQVLGSPAHMAPEQIEGREVDGRADVYGMGVLLYECMVGHLPFEGTNPAQVLRRVLEGEYKDAEHDRPTVGRAWSRILDRALAPDVALRFATAPEMRDALMRELARLGVTAPRGEIEAWLDDPAGFTAAQAASMATKLCQKGEEAARRGDPLTAAADYNRALAYSPHDAALLKIVSRLNRRSARAHVLRRAWPYAAGALVLACVGVGARYSTARAHRNDHPEYLTPIPTETPVPFTAPLVPHEPTGASPDLAASARTLARPVVAVHASSTPKPTVREVRFSSVEPSYGVLVSIDGTPAGPLDPGKPLSVDSKPHSLTFTCNNNVCDALSVDVEAGDRPVALPIRLKVKPSKLIVTTTSGNHYFLKEDPGSPLHVGEFGNVIPILHGSTRLVHVEESETNKERTVELTATKTSTVDFNVNP